MHRRFQLVILCLFMLTVCSSATGGDAKATRVAKLEEEIIELTNQERQNEKLPPLKPNPKLAKVARLHSDNMARQEKMAHELDGKKPSDRVKESGYRYANMGENVAYGQRSAAEVVRTWMNSEGHRENILRKEFTEIGIGVGVTDKGVLYYTQVFGRPLRP